MKNNFQTPIVLLVNGEFPVHPAPIEILKSADELKWDISSAKLLKQHLIIKDG